MPEPALHLTELHALPPSLLTTPARLLHTVLPGPTLIHLPGRREPALFVCALLHGNEDVGLAALQMVLRKHARQPLPRALSLFIGNIEAAAEGLRRLDGQPDYNRAWPGTVAHVGTPEHGLMTRVHDIMRARGVFASLDIHNNTGLNPHYSVVTDLTPQTLHLARLFSRTVVWFRGTPGTQTGAFSSWCPSVAVECGQPGQATNEMAAARFIEAALHLSDFPDHPLPASELDLYHALAVVKVAPEVSFGFGDPDAALRFDAEMDHRNFVELPAGAVFAHSTHPWPLQAWDEQGQDVTEALFERVGDALQLARPAMPAMITRDLRVVRQDCLCYLMERVPRSLVGTAMVDGTSQFERRGGGV